MSVVIKAENLSKAYQLGEIGTGTISQDLERFWARIRGKEDPFLKIGEVNDRTVKGESNIIWGLKDLNFEIERGAAVGIIGRNGAGKSTLLKILSRVTSPTTGSVKIKGRVASLLEVGTGFHPELTGRENIYLNGAILGMRKAEIKRKFDEIVDFSGVERYIDTPVKRYSSGMYVRLAFAVAAHLESEILIVDEILAVGDAEFQKKCLGKMTDISKGEGRTVLFVSHNMQAVSKLCNRGIYLKNSSIESFNDNIDDTISIYLNDVTDKNICYWAGDEGDENIRLKKLLLRNGDHSQNLKTDQDLFVEMQFDTLKDVPNLIVGLHLHSSRQHELCFTGLFDKLITNDELEKDYIIKKGSYNYQIKIPANTLSAGTYKINPNIGIYNVKSIIFEDISIEFQLLNISGFGRKFLPGAGLENIFRPNWEWNLID